MQGLQGTTQLAMTGAVASSHLKHNVNAISKDVRATGEHLAQNASTVLDGAEGSQGGFMESLKQMSADFQAGMNESISQGSDALASGLGKELDRQRVDTLERADETLSRNVNTATSNLNIKEVGQAAKDVSKAAAATTGAAGVTAGSAAAVPIVLHQGIRGINETIDKRSAEINAIMQTNLRSIDQNGNKLIETIDASGGKMISAIDAQGNQLTETIDASGNRLYHQGENLVFAVDQHGTDISSSIDTASNELTTSVDAAGTNVSTSIDGAGASTSAAIAASVAMTDEQLRAQGRAAQQQLQATAEARLFAKSVVITNELDSLLFGLELFETGAPLAQYANDQMLRAAVIAAITDLNEMKAVQLAEMTDTQFDEYVLRKKNLDVAQFKLTGARLEIVKVLQEVDEGVYTVFLTTEEKSEINQIRTAFAEQLNEAVQLSVAKLNATGLAALKEHMQVEVEETVQGAVTRHQTAVEQTVIGAQTTATQTATEAQDAVTETADVAREHVTVTTAAATRSVDEIREEMEIQAERQTEIALAQQKLVQLKLDAEDLKIAIRSGGGGGGKIKVRHILISADKTGAEALANTLYAELVERPAFFPARARTHSDDVVTKNSGGVRNYFSRGTYDAGFENAAFAITEEMGFAPLTKTSLGYQIIQLIDRQALAASSSTDDQVMSFNDRADALIEDMVRLNLPSEKAEVEGLKAEIQTEVGKVAPVRSNVGVGSLF